MIDAKELRVGNYVSNGIHPFKANIYTIQTAEYGTALGEINPIPLTEEILVKCGFECDGVCFKTKSNYFRLSLFQFNKANDYNDNENEFKVTVYQHHNSVEICRIKHLHQLQNLYFALTGQELNVEL